MRVKISWRGVEKEIRDGSLVEKKLSGLEKLIRSFRGKVREIEVVIKKRFKRGFQVSLFFNLPTKGIQTKGSGENVERAVIEAREKMERKLKKHMEQLREVRKRKEVKER